MEEFRSEFHPRFNALFNSHHAIVDATEYADFIDSTLHDFYIKGGIGHLIIRVKSSKPIKARSLLAFCNGILDELDEFGTQHNVDYDTSDVDARIHLHSPGAIELAGAAAVVFGIGVILVGLAGGKIKWKDQVEMGTGGVLKQLLDYIANRSNRQQKRELIQWAMEEMDVKDPKDIAKLLKELDSGDE